MRPLRHAAANDVSSADDPPSTRLSPRDRRETDINAATELPLRTVEPAGHARLVALDGARPGKLA